MVELLEIRIDLAELEMKHHYFTFLFAMSTVFLVLSCQKKEVTKPMEKEIQELLMCRLLEVTLFVRIAGETSGWQRDHCHPWWTRHDQPLYAQFGELDPGRLRGGDI